MKNDKKLLYKDSFFSRNIMLFFIGIAFICVGSFLFVLTFMIKNGTITFIKSSNILDIVLISSGIALVLLGILLLYLKYNKVLKRQFYLDNNEIITIYKGNEETRFNFNSINQVYRYKTINNKNPLPVGIYDCLAYRKSENDNWITLRPILKNKETHTTSSHLINQIIKAYVDAQCNISIEKLNTTGELQFIYLKEINSSKRNTLDKLLLNLSNKSLDVSNSARKTMNFCDAPRITINLNATGFTFDNAKIEFQQGDRVITKPYNIGTITPAVAEWEIGSELIILDKEDKVKHSLDINSMINGDLFVCVVKELVKRVNEVVLVEESVEVVEDVEDASEE